MKYVSDRADQLDALIVVPPGASFTDMKALRGARNIGEGMDTIIASIAEENDLTGVIDRAFFNDPEKFGRGTKMISTLTALINIFSREELNFSKNRADGDDILGDAYEYLMRNFATEAGKSKGQFYTPAEVSQIVAAVAGVSRATSPRQSVYDPTCGSGSLLLKAAESARVPISIFGQEMDIATRGLARMNMIMHNRETAEIAQGDVIAEPHFLADAETLQTFDFVVAKGFIKDGNKNRLRARDIHKITDAFTRVQEIPGYSRLVPYAEIIRNDFNLNIPRYIDGNDPEDLQDITAHLHGGVPERDIDALADFWDVMPTLRATLFGPNPRKGYADPLVAPDQVRTTIRNHPDFAAFRAQIAHVLNGWITENTPALMGIQQGDHPKELIHTIAEDMLTRFDPAPLVDKYEAYQRLMSYWADTMQDDVFIISGGGWIAARDLREARKETGSDGKVKWLEEGDLTVNKIRLVADVIPPALVTARFFPELKDALDTATARAEGLGREIEELAEEHGAEGGLLADALTDTGKLTAASVKARERSGEADAEERPLLKQADRLIESETAAKREAKEAEAALTEAVLKKYPALTEDDIRALVVQDKWLADISAAIGAEVEARTEGLTARVRVLTERYGQTLPQIMDDLGVLEARVAGHLAAMGIAG
ncbi:N-6 DNA methylase [Pseudotabrizicola sediminis]|uniref:N-6 DNA methylase n=1 Tax=Pseudotabrizicola sediminis TaxID=2486418 RepID=UPI001AEBE577